MLQSLKPLAEIFFKQVVLAPINIIVYTKVVINCSVTNIHIVHRITK